VKHRVSVAASYSPAPSTPSSEEKELMDVGSASGGGGGGWPQIISQPPVSKLGVMVRGSPSSSVKKDCVGSWQRPTHMPLQPLSSRNRHRSITTLLRHTSTSSSSSPPPAAAAAAASSMDDEDEEAEDDDKDVEEKGEGGEETAEEEVEETEEEEKADAEGTAAAVTAAADAPASVVVVVVGVDGGRIHSSVRHSPTRKRMRKGVRNPSSSMLSLLFCSSWK
jgi:hypothetical protein